MYKIGLSCERVKAMERNFYDLEVRSDASQSQLFFYPISVQLSFKYWYKIFVLFQMIIFDESNVNKFIFEEKYLLIDQVI